MTARITRRSSLPEFPTLYFEATNWNLGKKDGYTQVDLEFGEQGWIWHTTIRPDRLPSIEPSREGSTTIYPLYVTLLYDSLTQFEVTP